jgi:hypothetical protein
VRDDIAVTECTVAQLKFKANADEPDNTSINSNEESHVAG